MHKIFLPDKALEIDFPENIYELSTSQYHYYVQLYLMMLRAHINFEEFRALLVYHFLNMSFSSAHHPDKDANLARLIELTEGFYEQVPGGSGVRPVIFCPVNLAQEFTHLGQKFTGPANALADATLKQFLDGLTLLNAFRQDENRKYLVKLFALFHHSQKRFRQKSLPVSESLAGQLPHHILYGFYFFFAGSVDFITSRDIHMDDGRTYNFAPLFQGGGSAKGVGPVAVLFDLASSGVFGDVEKTEKINLIDALVFLLKTHQDNEEARKKLRKK